MNLSEHTYPISPASKTPYVRHNIKNMRFSENTDTLFTTTCSKDINKLAMTKTGSIRRYTQLEPATSEFSLSEFQLDGALLLRETLNTSMQIEAAPPENYIPIGVMIHSPPYAKFCGQDFGNDMLLQASGGVWDLSFKDGVDYAACILDKSILADHSETFLKCDLPKEWLTSQARRTNTYILNILSQKICNAFSMAKHYPGVFKHTRTRQFITGDIIHCAFKTLSATQRLHQQLPASSRRTKAVNRVIDYLKVHLTDLPTMSELCKIAQVSERTLEYAFKERFGVSPIKYMNLLRLNGAYRELDRDSIRNFGVTEVALSWGFSDLGRFSKYYHALFNELPSRTLQRARAIQ
jgi:AraC family ethanolamine operon transcriptional activator